MMGRNVEMTLVSLIPGPWIDFWFDPAFLLKALHGSLKGCVVLAEAGLRCCQPEKSSLRSFSANVDRMIDVVPD